MICWQGIIELSIFRTKEGYLYVASIQHEFPHKSQSTAHNTLIQRNKPLIPLDQGNDSLQILLHLKQGSILTYKSTFLVFLEIEAIVINGNQKT